MLLTVPELEVAWLKVFRSGTEREISVTLGELPATPERGSTGARGGAAGPTLGITAQQLTPEIARQLGLPAGTTGVVVADVRPTSPAEAAGLRRGDHLFIVASPQ